MPLYKASASELAALVAADNNTSGFIKDTEGFRVLAASGVLASHTGSTSETALATIAVPAGAMGANGILRVTSLWSYTNSANTKTLRMRLGGLAGTLFMEIAATTTAYYYSQRLIQNRNSQSSQIGQQGGTGTFTTAANATTGTVDTSSAQDLVLTGQLASAGETITLEGYIIELKYGA
jgi:uncharacterized protein YbjQ (UPF0145 family)